jgi:O-Antigen ligase
VFLLPAALLLLFGLWSGTFTGGATALGAGCGQAALLGASLLAAGYWIDPLRLGRAGRWVPLALWVALAASAWASPVARAGRVGLILLPAFLLVPTVVERAWQDERTRRLGLRALAAVVGGVALGSLLYQWRHALPRTGMPLGHHNLLAGWLVAGLPAALLPLREKNRWRFLGLAAGLLAVAAVLASRSLLGAAALGVQAALLLLWTRRWHRWMVPVALLVLSLQLPRVATIFSGSDPSARARLVYLDAGWRGLEARPLLGWGPGSVPWTIAEFLRPIPGVNPPSEIVGDLHSLPLQILYELGGTGFLFTLGTAALFLRRRVTERGSAEDPPLLAAGLIGLLGAAVTRLGGASLSITALPVAVAVAAGVALAALPRRPRLVGPWLGGAYVAVAVLALLPLLRAQVLYERAAVGRETESVTALERAVDLDPELPLYRARLAWLRGTVLPTPTAAKTALRAAEQANAVAPFWLMAGRLGRRADAAWAAAALERAAALDPLAASAPFERLLASPADSTAACWGARALLAEPRLLGATAWRGHEALRARAVAQLAAWPGVDLGWRAAVVECAAASRLDGDESSLGLELDLHPEPARSFSLHAFRRVSWPAVLSPVEVVHSACGEGLVPATTMAGTSANPAVCGAG